MPVIVAVTGFGFMWLKKHGFVPTASSLFSDMNNEISQLGPHKIDPGQVLTNRINWMEINSRTLFIAHSQHLECRPVCASWPTPARLVAVTGFGFMWLKKRVFVPTASSLFSDMNNDKKLTQVRSLQIGSLRWRSIRRHC